VGGAVFFFLTPFNNFLSCVSPEDHFCVYDTPLLPYYLTFSLDIMMCEATGDDMEEMSFSCGSAFCCVFIFTSSSPLATWQMNLSPIHYITTSKHPPIPTLSIAPQRPTVTRLKVFNKVPQVAVTPHRTEVTVTSDPGTFKYAGKWSMRMTPGLTTMCADGHFLRLGRSSLVEPQSK
jgi:hypothetical protein